VVGELPGDPCGDGGHRYLLEPVFAALEDRFVCWLLNAQHFKNVPGRKTAVIDSAWIAQLLEHGLVRPSFVPPIEIRSSVT